MKKKRIILISILLLVFAGVIWFNTGSEPPIVVTGNPSAKDIAEIKRVVRKEVRRQLFPDFSWKSVKELPRNFKFYSQFKIKSVEFITNDPDVMYNYAYVNFPYGKHAVHEEGFFRVIQGTYSWSISYSARMDKLTTTVTSPAQSHP